LIEGSTGLALWSDTYQRGANELLSVQQAIVEEIVRQVLPEGDAVPAAPATRDADANELMLLAQYYEKQVRSRQEVDTERLLEAVSLYRQAVEADPDSALAHSRLAGALLYLGDVDAAEAPIFRALSLDPNLSEVQNTLGEFYWARGRPEAATAFARAVELNPNNADALHNYASEAMLSSEQVPGINERLEQIYRRAMELDPLSLSRHAALGEFLGNFGHADKIPAVINKIQELFDNAESYRLIGWLQELSGNLDRAIAWTLRARNLESDNIDHTEKLAELYTLIGDFDTAMRLDPQPGVGVLFLMRRYAELIDLAELQMIEHPEDIDIRYLLAFAYQAEGRFEGAIHVLSTTGLPDSLINGIARSVSEIEAFKTLINSLAGLEQPEARELARSLAQWEQELPWWGDPGWIGVNRGCGLAILGRDEEALQALALVRESARLRREPYVRDYWCFQRYAQTNEPRYMAILQDQEERRARLRARLPMTLADFGVSL
jgi:tetratricopeptide (TPR) repeat protein